MNNNKIELINLENILYSYTEDKVIQTIINKAIKYFALGLVNLVKTLDTKSIVLYGSFFKNELMFNLLKETVDGLGCPSSERLSRSTLPDIKSIGAISLARKKLFFDNGAKAKGWKHVTIKRKQKTY